MDPEDRLREIEAKLISLREQIGIQNEQVRLTFKSIEKDLAALHAEYKDLETQIKENSRKFVSSDRYAPVEKLMYGFVGFVLISVLAAIMTLVIRSTNG